MKRLVIASSIAALFSSAALAADLPERRVPVFVAPLPVHSWTGLYVGADLGYAFGRDSQFITIPGVLAGDASSSRRGITGGGHIGYNLAPFAGGNVLLGFEGDFMAADDRTNVQMPTLTTINRKDYGGSVRARLGFTVDRALFYATGGAAFAQFHNNYFGAGSVDSNLDTRPGYTVGGGVEYAITPNWSVRGEFRYSDFGSYTNTLTTSTAPVVGATVSHRETEQQATIGFSYRFDSFVAPVPVVAKY